MEQHGRNAEHDAILDYGLAALNRKVDRGAAVPAATTACIASIDAQSQSLLQV